MTLRVRRHVSSVRRREARLVEEALARPRSEQELIAVQAALAQAAESASVTRLWAPPATAPLIAGCFVAYATGEAGPGHAGDRARAAAVVWRPVEPAVVARSPDRVLRQRGGEGGPRQADEVVRRLWPAGASPLPTPRPSRLREDPLLAHTVGALDVRPDVLLVDATGFGHLRRAQPPLVRGMSTPLFSGDRAVARWL